MATTNSMIKDLTQKELKELFDYDKDTGIFTWRVDKGTAKKGSVAGCESKGYISIRINGKLYLAHRLVWLYIYGYFPENLIDHNNGIKNDNRISNLTPVGYRCNGQNCNLSSANKSGYNGVHWDKRDKKWISQIRFNGKPINLGSYDCKLEAGLARLTAEDFDDRWTCDIQCVSRKTILADLKEWLDSRK